MKWSSIRYSLFLLFLMACGAATTVQQVRIQDVPQFICPSITPRPTHTAWPTQSQPPVYIPPSGFVTFTAVPGCMWNGYLCASNTPIAGGVYQQPGYFLPGATSTPRPTHTPWPTPTPFILIENFHLGADVYTGSFDSALRLRLRIDGFIVVPLTATRQIVTWRVEIENVGSTTYVAIPGGQIFLAELGTPSGTRTGQWWASAEAARSALIPDGQQLNDAITLPPGAQISFQLAAFSPVGDPQRFGWALDPLSGGQDQHLIGGNVAYWGQTPQPDCVGNLGSGGVIPTPMQSRPTATPTITPIFPPWCSWCR
jgi:hypothetical protein